MENSYLCQKKMMHKTGYIFCGLWMLIHSGVYGQESYHEAVAQGLRYQIQADSVQRLADMQVLALPAASESAKNGIRIAIRAYEAQTAAFQKKAGEYFTRAVALEKEFVPKVAENEVSLPDIPDTDTIAEANINPEAQKPQNTQPTEFAILSKSPYTASNPVPVDEPLPDGVAYKIQLGAFSKALPVNAFRGLTPLSGEKLPNGITKYYVGLFRYFSDAEDALRKVHQYGFKDAYIVAFFNRLTINTNRARQLESTIHH